MKVNESYELETRAENQLTTGQETPSSPPVGSVQRIVVVLVAILAVAAVVYWGIAARMKNSAILARETQEMAVPTVLVVHPKRAAPAQEVVLPGNIQPFTDSPIYARTNGYLKRWYVDIGAHVKAGQLLAEIDTPEVDQQLEQSRSNLATAQANFRLADVTKYRYQGLLATHAVSQQDVDNAAGCYDAK